MAFTFASTFVGDGMSDDDDNVDEDGSEDESMLCLVFRLP